MAFGAFLRCRNINLRARASSSEQAVEKGGLMAIFLYDMMDEEWVGCSFLQIGTMAKI